MPKPDATRRGGTCRRIRVRRSRSCLERPAEPRRLDDEGADLCWLERDERSERVAGEVGDLKPGPVELRLCPISELVRVKPTPGGGFGPPRPRRVSTRVSARPSVRISKASRFTSAPRSVPLPSHPRCWFRGRSATWSRARARQAHSHPSSRTGRFCSSPTLPSKHPPPRKRALARWRSHV